MLHEQKSTTPTPPNDLWHKFMEDVSPQGRITRLIDFLKVMSICLESLADQQHPNVLSICHLRCFSNFIYEEGVEIYGDLEDWMKTVELLKQNEA